MFEDDPSQLEIDHRRLVQALNAVDPGRVKEVLDSNPKAAQPMPGWSQSPLQLLAGSIHTFSCSEEKLVCLDLLLEHGADPGHFHGHYPSPIQTLLTRGCLTAVERMHQKGFLTHTIHGHIKGSCLGHFISSANCWREFGGDYPLDGMMKCLLDAGLDPTKSKLYPDGTSPVLKQLLMAAVPQYGIRTPKTTEAACIRLIAADNQTTISPSFLVQAFRSGYQQAFTALWARFHEQGNDIALLDEKINSFKPEERAQFEAWMLNTHTTPATQASANSRRVRI